MKEIKSVPIIAGGGGSPEPHQYLALNDRTTKNVTVDITFPCHREERANASAVAIHWRPWRFNGIATHPADARNDACEQAAFTMAEILLSLTIIGVVAAITLPSLTGNINERTWNTQRKALYARFSQAIALMPSLNGYGTLKEASSAGASDAVDTAAETFVTDGLAKVLKINNICDNDHLADCGIVSTLTTLNGNTISMPSTMKELNAQMISASTDLAGGTGKYNALDTKAAAFETQNGESIALFYNPTCTSYMGGWTYMVQPMICANMIYDLNGNKGPNTVGKDIGFVTVLYPTDSSVVAPMPFNRIVTGVTSENAGKACLQNVGENYRLPTKDELAALFINRSLLGYSADTSGTGHWYSSSKYAPGQNWLLVQGIGEYRVTPVDGGWTSLCVKR